MPTCTSRPRWTPSAGCSACRSSRPRRPATPSCWPGWAGSGPCAWSGSREPAATARACPGHVTAAGVRVVEVDRSDRQDRRRQGKSDPLDAVSAARARPVRPGPRRAQGPRRRRRGDPGSHGRQAQRRRRTHPDDQPGQGLILTGPEDLRARFTGHTVAALVAELASLRPRPGSTVGYATRIALRELGRRAEFLDAQIDRLDELITPLVDAPSPRAARPPRDRPQHRGAAAHRRRGPPRTAPLRGRLGAPVRRRPDPRLLRQDRPPPAEPRRRPPGQPRLVADRVHPHGLSPGYPRLRRTAHRRGEVQEGNHPLPEALRRPRGLPPPPRFRRLNAHSRGRPGPIFGCRTCWPANDPPAVPGAPQDLLSVTS